MKGVVMDAITTFWDEKTSVLSEEKEGREGGDRSASLFCDLVLVSRPSPTLKDSIPSPSKAHLDWSPVMRSEISSQASSSRPHSTEARSFEDGTLDSSLPFPLLVMIVGMGVASISSGDGLSSTGEMSFIQRALGERGRRRGCWCRRRLEVELERKEEVAKDSL